MGMEISWLNVRCSIFILVKFVRVWEEFVLFEMILMWFGFGYMFYGFEFRLGGFVCMSVELDGEEYFYGGLIMIFEFEREVFFEVNWEGD